jgi:Pyruvate/2-oxoacid:ferredoxin oxidoreductase gamma subunit
MNDIYQIRLTGSGGQGLVTAGIIVAEAAIIDGNDAVQTQSYGAEARGGGRVNRKLLLALVRLPIRKLFVLIFYWQ